MKFHFRIPAAPKRYRHLRRAIRCFNSVTPLTIGNAGPPLAGATVHLPNLELVTYSSVQAAASGPCVASRCAGGLLLVHRHSVRNVVACTTGGPSPLLTPSLAVPGRTDLSLNSSRVVLSLAASSDFKLGSPVTNRGDFYYSRHTAKLEDAGNPILNRRTLRRKIYILGTVSGAEVYSSRVCW